MSWGTAYRHEGYLSRVHKSQIPHKKEECIKTINELWAVILSYMSATPPAYAKSDDGYEYPYSEFIVRTLNDIREELEDNMYLLHCINDCEEAMENDPDNVKEN